MDCGPVALELALAEDEVEQRGQHHAALQRRRHRSGLVEPDPHDQEAGERPRDEPAKDCPIKGISSSSTGSWVSIGGILYHLGCRACTRGSACTKGRAGTTFQFCTSDGLIGVWCKHYLWCHPSGLIDLNEPLGSCSTFLVPAPKKIGTELKVVHGASTKWCVVLGAWP